MWHLFEQKSFHSKKKNMSPICCRTESIKDVISSSAKCTEIFSKKKDLSIHLTDFIQLFSFYHFQLTIFFRKICNIIFFKSLQFSCFIAKVKIQLSNRNNFFSKLTRKSLSNTNIILLQNIPYSQILSLICINYYSIL